MKFAIVLLALAAVVMADVSELGYGYEGPAAGAAISAGTIAASAPDNSYIPPAASAPDNSYIPPAASAPIPDNSYIPPAAAGAAEASEPIQSIDDGSAGPDGYRYRTVRRRVYRRRF